MGGKISASARKELLDALSNRYRNSIKKDKTRILDEFVALSGYHRKHAIRQLGDRCTMDETVQNSAAPNETIGRKILYVFCRNGTIGQRN